MANPVWTTAAGNLGIVSDDQYLDIQLVAVDPGGNPVTFSTIAGQTPPGSYVTPSGEFKGVPVITNTANLNETYQFTVRATATDKSIADRTFSLTVTNIIPPAITPRVSFLGEVFDGSFYSLQLEAVEVNPEATLTWTLENGNLPMGLAISSSGLISGFILPLNAQGQAGLTGYSSAAFSEFGYDNAASYTNNQYTFTVRVFDGTNYDSLTYSLTVIAKGNWSADTTVDLVNYTYISVDADNRYVPIVTTPAQSLPEVRSASKFAFKFNAIDPNQDPISFGVYTFAASGFDDINFDETGFDQDINNLPAGLTLDPTSGWLSGTLGNQVAATESYTFQIYAYKTQANTYVSKSIPYTITVLGDINDTITWITSGNLGVIDNGSVSELYVSAVNNAGKQLTYSLVDLGSRLPQGLSLLPSGLISGRTTFEYFSLDKGSTTIDGQTTTFDDIYDFTVEASTTDASSTSTQKFSISINNFNRLPYENLYISAFLDTAHRDSFLSIINDQNIFPDSKIYRASDPWFGKASGLRSLFLPGINPHQLSDYISAMSVDHFNKRMRFGNVKTARAVDSNFNTKYEVVYVELIDDQIGKTGGNPAAYVDLAGKINPYYDANGSSYTTLYNNSFINMANSISGSLNFANQGALPDWMTSPQSDGKVLGLTRSVVLAYTLPGASDQIKYQLESNNINFSYFDFVADRYTLDNLLTQNFDTATNSFITGKETTFDRISRVGGIDFTVSYAVRGISFEDINNQTVGHVQGLGGFDGVTDFNDGDLMVFAQQEGFPDALFRPNDGWNLLDSNQNIIGVIPGFLNSQQFPGTVNQRGGIWRINITTPQGVTLPSQASDFGSDLVGFDTRNFDVVTDWPTPPNQPTQLVTLSFVSAVAINDRIQVNLGETASGTVIFYDPTLKFGKSVPEYTTVNNNIIGGSPTIFDSQGTRFFTNRDSYSVPAVSDKYLKYPHIGAFN